MSEKARVSVKSGDVVAGKYRVERVLGHGGMGLVVLATHLLLKQEVALKILLGDIGQANSARFLREAQALATLRGPHAVRVMDVGTLETGEPYFVMEYLRGQNLRQLLEKTGRLTPEQATSYLLQVCDALGEAHAKGIIHRDLKPSNLFLAEDEHGARIRLLDFGISKVVDAAAANDVSLTDTGALLGSPKYMAPEQVRGARNVDSRVDIWAMGAIGYELLCGRPPFTGDTAASILAAVAADTPRHLADRVPGLPLPLAAAIMRCLQKQPDLRFDSIADFACALEPFTSDSGPLQQRILRIGRASRPPSTSASGEGARIDATGTLRTVLGAQRARPNRPRWLGGIGLLLCLGLAGSVAWLLSSRPAPTLGGTRSPASATQSASSAASAVAQPPEPAFSAPPSLKAPDVMAPSAALPSRPRLPPARTPSKNVPVRNDGTADRK